MIRFRLATPADRDLVRRLLAVEHAHYFDEVPTDRDLDTPLADILDHGTCAMLLALEGDEGVGFATFAVLHPSTNHRGTLFLKDLYVVAARRGSGLGSRLLAELARIARARGCSRFDWTTESDNPGAQRLYDRLGAHRIDEKIYYRVPLDEMDRFIARCGAQQS